MLPRSRDRLRRIKLSNDINVIIEKGVVRFLYLVLDFSAAMAATDLRPTRALAAVEALDQFVKARASPKRGAQNAAPLADSRCRSSSTRTRSHS